MNIKKRIYYKANAFVKKENRIELARRNNLKDVQLAAFPLDVMEMMETVANHKRNSNVLLDIGAHKGLFTAVANCFFSFDQTICFEPNVQLNKEIQQNNKGVHVKIENLALAEKTGVTKFHLHEDSSMNSILEADTEVLKSEFPWDNPDLLKETEVQTDTLDNYIEKNGLQNNTFFIKIDTQGNELNVLKNSLNTLKNTELLLIEYMFLTPYKTDFAFFELIQFMNQHHFECKGALTIKKRPSKKVSAVDFLFVKKTTRVE